MPGFQATAILMMTAAETLLEKVKENRKQHAGISTNARLLKVRSFTAGVCQNDGFRNQ